MLELVEAPIGPGPLVHPENEAFWERLGDGVFCLQRCASCGLVRFPVAPCCHNCLATAFTWDEVAGDGVVSAAVRVERATGRSGWEGAVPYITGLVDTSAGVRLPGRILCDCGQGTRHGAPVRMVRLRTQSGTTTYAFAHRCRTA